MLTSPDYTMDEVLDVVRDFEHANRRACPAAHNAVARLNARGVAFTHVEFALATESGMGFFAVDATVGATSVTVMISAAGLVQIGARCGGGMRFSDNTDLECVRRARLALGMTIG